MTTIARPTELPEWATNDISLPSGQGANKVDPSLVLRQIGYDYLSLPTAQEENAWRNNVYRWTGHNTERVDTLITELDTLESEVAAINSFDLDFQHVGSVLQGRVDMANFLWQWGAVDMIVPDALFTAVSQTVTYSTPFPTGILLTQTTLASDGSTSPDVIISAFGENNQITITAKRINLPSGTTNEQITVGYLVAGT